VTIDGVTAKTPVTLDAPFTVSAGVVVHMVLDSHGNRVTVKAPGETQVGRLILRRPASSRTSDWFAWAVPNSMGLYATHDVDLNLVDDYGKPIASWRFMQCLAAEYKFQPGSNGVPTEQVSLIPAAWTRTQAFKRADMVSPDAYGTFLTAGTIPGRAPVIGSFGNASDVIVVSPPDGPPYSVLNNPTGSDISVQTPVTSTPDMLPWFLDIISGTFTRRNSSITVQPAGGVPAFAMTATNTWPSRYTLTPCQDGGLIEQFNIVNDAITR
jgi:hypothetical protein